MMQTENAADLSSTAAALRDELARALTGEVNFDIASRAMYAQDASHYRQVPVGVARPRSVDETIEAVRICRAHGAPLLMRGAGTSLAGQACNAAVILDLSRHLDRIIEIDPQRRIARVQPGVVLDDLRSAAEQFGLTFGPDPSTHAVCTIGGMIANNACGVHSQTAGRTSDNVETLDLLTYDGARLHVGETSTLELARIKQQGGRAAEIYTALEHLCDEYAPLIRARYPKIPRRVSGYNLDELLAENNFNVARALAGTEGTCAVMLEATVRLVPSPAARALVLMGYPDVAAAGDAVKPVLAHEPIGLEGTADSLIDNMRAKRLEHRGLELLPEGGGWLFAEFGGATRAEAADKARRFMQADLAPRMTLLEEPDDMQAVWAARESAVGASARLADGVDTWSGWEDAAVPPERLGDYLRDFQALLQAHGYRATIYGHFGQGCVHARIDFDLHTEAGLERYQHFIEDAADLVVRYGGSLSGEHGDGQSRAALLHKMFGPELVEAFTRFKHIWDPANRMDPGKVVTPRPSTEDLRLGPDYTLPQLDTRFQYPDDQRYFARAVNRCNGVGKCRRATGGTMCPSYKVTREEQHSTRGRARLLQEMTRGTLPNGWENEAVKESLDLCLACKGCKGECPAGVDVATYKAEFLAHYYARRRRPRHAYVFGLVDRWAALLAKAPRLARTLLRLPGMTPLAKRIAGVAPRRDIPLPAPRTFHDWFGQRGKTKPTDGALRVILWPDTFNNHFYPQALRAATRVLEQAGADVTLPKRGLCCGRPLYDYGMLDRAKRYLEQVLAQLREPLCAGALVVGLEPSCVAVFRDELTNLFPDDADAPRLAARTLTLAEFLNHHAPHYTPPTLHGRVLFHGHCHHKAIMGADEDVALLRATGLTLDMPDSGCCGMAGAFGFECAHYDVSVRVGEQVLLPAVRAAGGETRIVTDGFSCREQIAQCTGRRALHLAEVLAPELSSDDGPSP